MYKLVFAPHNCGPALIFGHFRSPFPSIKYPSEALVTIRNPDAHVVPNRFGIDVPCRAVWRG